MTEIGVNASSESGARDARGGRAGAAGRAHQGTPAYLSGAGVDAPCASALELRPLRARARPPSARSLRGKCGTGRRRDEGASRGLAGLLARRRSRALGRSGDLGGEAARGRERPSASEPPPAVGHHAVDGRSRTGARLPVRSGGRIPARSVAARRARARWTAPRICDAAARCRPRPRAPPSPPARAGSRCEPGPPDRRRVL
jgi:hypothetical protein